MAYRSKKTIRRLRPIAKKLNAILADNERMVRALKKLVDDVQVMETELDGLRAAESAREGFLQGKDGVKIEPEDWHTSGFKLTQQGQVTVEDERPVVSIPLQVE